MSKKTQYAKQLVMCVFHFGMYVAVVCCFVGFARAASANPAAVTAQEYQLYMDYREGREDARLQKMSDAQKRKAIARSLGVSATELSLAIDKVERVQPSLAEDTSAAISRALEQTELRGRVLDVYVDASQGHVVSGVKWRCGDERDRAKEASFVAWAVNEGGPIVKTLALWCVDANDSKLFSAKIGRSGFEKVQKETIERFATTRFIRLFEDVRWGPHT